MQLCESCTAEFEPKEWIYVGSALWARCRVCFSTFEVGHLGHIVREQVGPSDSELELQLWARGSAGGSVVRGSSPPLSRVCAKKLAESLARFRAERVIIPDGVSRPHRGG